MRCVLFELAVSLAALGVELLRRRRRRRRDLH